MSFGLLIQVAMIPQPGLKMPGFALTPKEFQAFSPFSPLREGPKKGENLLIATWINYKGYP
jgi:hypothetical protein